jgi:O-methyltransferase involved in polyketide biosynthesis
MVGGEADSMTRASRDNDLERPNLARVYDYYLGGDAHFAVDRELAEATLALLPNAHHSVRADRAFLGRVVRYLIDQGIDQFLDLGSGVPTVGNVHEMAQRFRSGVRVAYVDVDPLAVAHARAMLVGSENVHVVNADIRQVDTVLAEAARLLDFRRPVAILAVAVLPFIPGDTELAEMLAAYRARCVAGSFLAVSHFTRVTLPPEQSVAVERFVERFAWSITWRTSEELAALLSGCALVDPGVVLVPDWRPEPGPSRWLPDWATVNSYGAVARICP